MNKLKYSIIIIVFSFLLLSCGAVNSQQSVNSKLNVNIEKTNTEKQNTKPDTYELSKIGAEQLNKQPLPKLKPEIAGKPFSRRQIREALSKNNLIGDSSNNQIGGYKIVHFSHVCNLTVESKPFYVVAINSILQNASFARMESRTLIFDDSEKLVHNLRAADPLFCDGNRLFFNDYEMTVFYGEPEKQVSGNVLIFSDKAKNIEGKMANLNFYKIGDLVY